MDTITLEQHWYGSAPVGLEVARGLQTIARSRGLSDWAPLKSHCVYHRPPGRRDPDLPVSWGWFRLTDGRVCLHRIGYAGTDELGRPGNFLAHNLIASEADLERIKYDIPTLLNWVRHSSPERYGQEGGGFAATCQQVYDKLGRDKAKLQNANPLFVEVKAIREFREQARQNFSAARDGLPAGVLEQLLGVLYGTADISKPIIVVSAGDGSNQSAAEMGLVDFLFGLLPVALRRQLTFTTYEHDLKSLLQPDRAGRPPSAHLRRRLVLTTAGTEVPGPSASGLVVIVDKGVRYIEAEGGNARRISAWVRDGDDVKVKQFCDLVDCFQFQNFSRGAELASGLVEGGLSPFSLSSCEKLAALLEENHEEGSRLLYSYAEAAVTYLDRAGRSEGLLGRLSEALLKLLEGIRSRFPEDPPEGFVGALRPLVRWALSEASGQLLSRLLQLFPSKPYLNVLCDHLYSTLAQLLGDPPIGLRIDHVMAQIRGALQQLSAPADTEMLNRLAPGLTMRLLCADGGEIEGLEKNWKLVVRVFGLTPLKNFQDFNDRFNLLATRTDPERAADLLITLLKKRVLTSEILYLEGRAGVDALIFRHGPVWRRAWERERTLIEGLRFHQSQFAVWCASGMGELAGNSEGFRLLFEDCTGQESPSLRAVANRWLEDYATAGADRLRKEVEALDDPENAGGFITFQLRLLRWISEEDHEPDLGPWRGHVVSLLAVLPFMRSAPGETLAHSYFSLVTELVKRCPDAAERFTLYRELLNGVEARAAGARTWDPIPRIEKWQAEVGRLWNKDGLDHTERRWLIASIGVRAKAAFRTSPDLSDQCFNTAGVFLKFTQGAHPEILAGTVPLLMGLQNFLRSTMHLIVRDWLSHPPPLNIDSADQVLWVGQQVRLLNTPLAAQEIATLKAIIEKLIKSIPSSPKKDDLSRLAASFGKSRFW